MSKIAFGTSGWRGLVCEDFTFDRVRVVSQAIAAHLLDQGKGSKGVVVGYDARFLGRRFAEEAALVLAANGIPAFLCDRDTPTPVISYEILRRGAAGGINITASHNPYTYNGVKFSPDWGGPALPEATRDIERKANALLERPEIKTMSMATAVQQGLVTETDPRDDYFAALAQHVDLKAIARGNMKIAVNTLYGSGRGYLDTLLSRYDVRILRVNDHLDPYFGGQPPEPSQSHMPEFIELLANTDDIRLGLATDGDADRFGIVDCDGSFIEPNYILALLYDYLIRRRKLTGDAARSVATSHFIDAVAAHHGTQVLETPVGFKYIGDYIAKGRILIGGEESAGLSIRGHVPEKDGILACLLVAEMVSVENASINMLLEDLYHRVGTFRTRRENLHLTPELADTVDAKLDDPPDELAGRRVTEVVRTDGCKLLLEGGAWALFRKSGTEPVVRVYGEAGTVEELDEVIAAASKVILD